MKVGHLLTPYTRINSKWIKDLNVRLETIKLLEENIGSKISDILLTNIFFLIYLLGEGDKRKINKWDYIKLKSFCTAKEIINKIKRQPTKWENIFADTSDKRLLPQICKEFTKLNTIKTAQLKRWA